MIPISRMNENNYERKNTGTATSVAREVVEAKIGLEALGRAGNNPQLKGIVHETAYKTMYNSSPMRILDGTKAVLSKSPTAVRDDILIMKNNVVVGRQQLKDTANSIGKTIAQVKDKHYVGTKLMGTPETAKKFAEAASKSTGVTQKMTSTGISSADTSRIASKTMGTNAGKLTATQFGKLASTSGGIGAAISGGIEVISSGVKFLDGEIEGGEFMKNVAKESVGGGLSAAAGSVAATTAATGVATGMAALGATGLAATCLPAVAAIGAAVAIGSAVKGLWDCLFY